MALIEVENAGSDRYRVTVTEGGEATTHMVSVDPDHGLLGTAPAKDLVEASFRFLLDREPKESIISSFDLGIISRFFPEYESTIGEYLD